MTLKLKIEIFKIFSLEFDFDSEKEKKKEKTGEKDSAIQSAAKSTSPSK